MVARPPHDDARNPGTWEPWEAKRLRPPPGLPVELREARADARLVLFVARARFQEGRPPWDLADRLAAVAQDDRVTARTQRVAAELLTRLRRAAWDIQAMGSGVPIQGATRPRGASGA